MSLTDFYVCKDQGKNSLRIRLTTVTDDDVKVSITFDDPLECDGTVDFDRVIRLLNAANHRLVGKKSDYEVHAAVLECY